MEKLGRLLRKDETRQETENGMVGCEGVGEFVMLLESLKLKHSS